MRASKTEAEANYEDMISLNEVRQVLHELECLGFVKRTGNSRMCTRYMLPPQRARRPAHELRNLFGTFKIAESSVTIWGTNGANDCLGKDTQWKRDVL